VNVAEPAVPGLEEQVHSQDRALTALVHAARRVAARLSQATKFRAPAWVPSAEEREQLAELRRILVAEPQQFFGGAGGPGPHILGESERAPMNAPVKENPEPGLGPATSRSPRSTAARCSRPATR
jgi:hypothetical protein